MTLLTNDKLQAMFQASRERKQKEREQHKKDRQQQYQLLCKEVDKLLKEEAERFKKEKMEQLQALGQKAAQKPRKQPQMTFQITEYHTRYIERYTPGEKLYQTREELKQAEERGEGKINWDAWNILITMTKEQLGL